VGPSRDRQDARADDGQEHLAALQGLHSRIDTTQVYASIRPPQLKRAVSFYEEKAIRILTE